MKIFETHILRSGKDEGTKLSNTNTMLNEVNKLQQFEDTINETQRDIEQEFETTKEIMEDKIYTSYASILQNSDLFSHLRVIDINIPDKSDFGKISICNLKVMLLCFHLHLFLRLRKPKSGRRT